MKIKIILFSFFLSFFITSCGIETFSILNELKPPLALEAEVIEERTVQLSFWAFNDEEFIEGYWIYISTNDNINIIVPVGSAYTNKEGHADRPTIWDGIKFMTEATQIVYVVNKYFDNTEFMIDMSYTFFVKAYSGNKNIYSKPSNLTNLVVISSVSNTNN